jgi:peptidoglycan/xylan/chitin deacetylase (PgdA/CDA1 family)
MRFSLMDTLLRSAVGFASPGGRRARLSILIYHRVLARNDPLNNWDVTASVFEGHMRALGANFFPLPLAEAVARLANGTLPARAACVTFDDGYVDNVKVALPILRRHRIPAAFFIASGYLTGRRMWNDTVVEAVRSLASSPIDLPQWGLGTLTLDSDMARRAAIKRILPALKHLPAIERDARASHLANLAGIAPESDLMMREEHVRVLHAAGMEIGAHSVTHPILANTSNADAMREISDSGRHLSDIVGAPIKLFAYPNGKPGQDYGPEHVRMVREARYSAAVSTAWGVATNGADEFQLPRFTPWDRSPGKFTLRLLRNLMNTRPTVAR